MGGVMDEKTRTGREGDAGGMQRLAAWFTNKIDCSKEANAVDATGFIFPLLFVVVLYLWCLSPYTFWTGFFTSQLFLYVVLFGPIERKIERVSDAWFSRKRFYSNIRDLDTACAWLAGIADFNDGYISFELVRKNRPTLRVSVEKKITDHDHDKNNSGSHGRSL